MDTPVLVLPFREGEENDLDRRMDNDYIEAFAPRLLALARHYGQSTAFILPTQALLPDQIELLKSRGAISGRARVDSFVHKRTFDLRLRPIDMKKISDHVCVFNHVLVNQQLVLEAYTVDRMMPMGIDQYRFGMSYGFTSYGGYTVPSTSS